MQAAGAASASPDCAGAGPARHGRPPATRRPIGLERETSRARPIA